MAAAKKCKTALLKERVTSTMSDGRERSTLDIALVLGVSVYSVANALRSLVLERDGQMIHVVRIECGKRIYVWGRGANVGASLVPKRGSRAAIDRDWAEADPATQHAMHAMVSVGHKKDTGAGEVALTARADTAVKPVKPRQYQSGVRCTLCPTEWREFAGTDE